MRTRATPIGPVKVPKMIDTATTKKEIEIAQHIRRTILETLEFWFILKEKRISRIDAMTGNKKIMTISEERKD
jgi:predicted DNA-binding ribbon-helix-helix protein